MPLAGVTGLSSALAGKADAAATTSALAGKQATLVSGTNIKTINGASLLGSGNIAITGGGGGGSSDELTLPTGDATTQYFLFEGDSLTATENTGSEAPDWTQRIMSLSQFSGRGTRLNVAEFGGVVTNVPGRYTTYAYPKRPGQDGITKAWYFFWNGINDAYVATESDYLTKFNDWKTSWDSVTSTAKADGFKVVAFTITKRPYTDHPSHSGFELMRALQNAHIRHSIDKYDILIDTDQLFRDNTDTVWFSGDFTHFKAAGRQKIAEYVNSVFAARGAQFFPPNPNAGGVAVGNGASEVPSNTLLLETPRAFEAPQGYVEATVADATTFNWNLDTQPNLRLPEIGSNKTINAPTNLRAGFTYRIILPFNSTGGYTITWNPVFKNVPTLNTGAYRHNILEFYCDGTYMIGEGGTARNFDATPPVEPGEGALVIELFGDPSGTGRTVRGTAPDTLNIPGNLWTAGRGEDWQAGNVAAGNPGYASNVGQSVSNVNDIESANFYATTLMRFADNTSSGHAGIKFRYVDTNNYWLFGINGAGQWTIWKVVGGNFAGVGPGGTFTYNDTTGHIVRVEATGTTILFKLDGTTVYTATGATDLATATKHGYGDVNLGNNKARWYEIELGT